MTNKFIVDSNSEPLDSQDVEKLIQKMVKNSCEFDVYFQNQSVSHYWCKYPDEKAEVVYDLMKGVSYYSPDKKKIYIFSNINNYGYPSSSLAAWIFRIRPSYLARLTAEPLKRRRYFSISRCCQSSLVIFKNSSLGCISGSSFGVAKRFHGQAC